jgi:hypothetical protein
LIRLVTIVLAFTANTGITVVEKIITAIKIDIKFLLLLTEGLKKFTILSLIRISPFKKLL